MQLKAVRLVHKVYIADKLQSAELCRFADNHMQNVVHILEVGSRKPNYQVQALSISKLGAQCQICAEPNWTPRMSVWTISVGSLIMMTGCYPLQFWNAKMKSLGHTL